jgi:hypothetical protein
MSCGYIQLERLAIETHCERRGKNRQVLEGKYFNSIFVLLNSFIYACFMKEKLICLYKRMMKSVYRCGYLLESKKECVLD